MKTKHEEMIAYHEAGHAVAARSLGIEVSYVTLLAVDAESGAVARTHSATWLARNDDQAAQLAAIEKDAKVCLAGPYAQSRHRPRRKMTEKIKQREWGDDISNARGFVARAVLVGHGVEVPDGTVTLNDDDAAEAVRIFNRISKETAALVTELWSAITRVAEELLRRHSLFADEVDALIADRLLALAAHLGGGVS